MSSTEPLRLLAHVGGSIRRVAIAATGPHTYEVTVDGVTHRVDACALGPGTFSLLIDERSYDLDVASDGEQHRVGIDGRSVEVRLADALRHGGLPVAPDVTGPQEIRAMMPGKVVAVLIRVGDRVDVDQGLLVVEAMKMENEVRAPAGGTVREIRVQPGQAVEANEVLVRLE